MTPGGETVGRDALMRYLDGEASPEERRRVEDAVARSTELRREVALFRAMKKDLQNLSFAAPPADESVWGRVHRRLGRPVGWLFLVAGSAVWSVYGVYLYLVSPANLLEKLATAAVVIGVLLLLAGVIWEQYRTWLIDPYKDVQR